MNTKKIIGIVILGASVGLLVYIYKGYNDTWIEQLKSQARINLGIDKVVSDKKKKNNTFVGLNKNILILSGIIIIGAIGYKIYQNRK